MHLSDWGEGSSKLEILLVRITWGVLKHSDAQAVSESTQLGTGGETGTSECFKAPEVILICGQGSSELLFFRPLPSTGLETAYWLT